MTLTQNAVPTAAFTELTDLASERVGGKALLANDEFFAGKENLLKPGRGIFIAEKFTSRGKWMDGWETRRKRTPGYDWCVIKLGLRGLIRGLDVDTNHFTGNFPESCSMDACDAPAGASVKALLKDPSLWTEIVPKTTLRGGSQNFIPVRSLRPWTHVKLNIFPDGGVARLRVHGDVVPDWNRLMKPGRPVDLAAVENGGLAVLQSDMFFGRATNMLMPGRAKNMGDGWETKRRRGPGHDWCVIKLGAVALLSDVEVDTNHFKGNYPDSCTIEGCVAPGASAAELAARVWTPVLPQTKLKAHHRHLFATLAARGPFSHLRLNIYPDGGISRLRVHGKPVTHAEPVRP
jgi:allantoicase